MPNEITSSGITIQTRDEILNELKNGTGDYLGFRAIYGDSANLEQNSPDGQMLQLFAQAKIDMAEFAVQVYNSFDPDQAYGVSLDKRAAINGINRLPGIKSVVSISITHTQTVTIPGLNTAPTAPFTVTDSTGNRFQLVATLSPIGTGTIAAEFQAATYGALAPAVNSLNIIATPMAGVLAVTNLATASVVGTPEETDAQLRVRRSRSVSQSSSGYLQGLQGALLGLPGVRDAKVLENNTGSTDSNGIPEHSIWAIVDQTPWDPVMVAELIDRKRNAGCGTYGTYSEPGPYSGLTLNFSLAFTRWLYVQATLTNITGTHDAAYLAARIKLDLTYFIGEKADSSEMVALIKEIYPNVAVSAEGVSVDGVTYSTLVNPLGANDRFKVLQVKLNGVTY